MPNEYPYQFTLLRAQRHADSDLARVLRDGIRNHAVDSESERHRSCNRQHGQRSGAG